jgi:endoglucanase
MNQRIGRAVNLGNALEAPAEGEWGVVLKEEFFQLIQGAGFTAVRIPTRWSAHAQTEAPYTIDPEFLQRVDWAVEQALSRGLVVVLNIHHYEEMALNPAAHRDRFLGLWKQIAEHYQSYPNHLLFELMNEPNGSLGAKLWNDLVVEALSVVRASNPVRNIVVGPVEWNNPRALRDLKLPADDQHLIVTFHYYAPFQFTHQGAEWVQGSGSWLGTEWTGSNAQRQSVGYDLDVVAQWATENQRPIFLGEFGAYSKADMASRAQWTAFVAREAESRGFSWAYWEFCAGFGVYDQSSGVWNQTLLQALLPPQ